MSVPSPEFDTIFGYPVYLDIQLGSKTYTIPGAIRLDENRSPQIDFNRIRETIDKHTQPCPRCGTALGEERRS